MLCAELKSRGYEAYDADEDQLARWYNTETGEEVRREDEQRTPEFVQAHSRDIAREKIEALIPRAQNKPVFLCGDPENEEDLQDLFSKIFALVIDDETLKQRLASRTNNSWGKLPHELAYSLAFQQKWYDNYKKFGYITLNSAEPPAVLADQILETAVA